MRVALRSCSLWGVLLQQQLIYGGGCGHTNWNSFGYRAMYEVGGIEESDA